MIRIGIVLVVVVTQAVAPPLAAPVEGDAVSVRVVNSPPFKDRARLAMDRDGLSAALRDEGYPLRASALYLVEIIPGVGQPAYVLHDAGAGAFWNGFYPLSSVKLTAAVAAVDWAAELGFTGAARVRFDDGFEATLRELYEAAITVSSNPSYDRTLQVAGLDYLNQELIPRFGLDSMWLGAAYAGFRIQDPPGYTLTEEYEADGLPEHLPAGDVAATLLHRVRVPGRTAEVDYRDWNDTDLFDLVDVLRRVMLNDELPHTERFGLPAADVAGLQDSLCRATPDLLGPGVTEALGEDARVCNKSGTWPEGACVDHAYVEEPRRGRRFLLAAVAPCNWPSFAAMATEALLVADELTGTPIQPDAGRSMGLIATASPASLRVELLTEADWALVWVDDRPPVIVAGDLLGMSLDLPPPGRHLLVAVTMEGGMPVGYRAFGLEVAFG
jgi:hypothetical protein